ncbi:hypothetical protein Cflav_PD4751 [Pedosphaera parvula Ellin514]|uniref:Uncharacterized protein n=1 Tax=Pedosphaera parvula (strain Ellin514) TaxID=320771 RepID=B9XEJ7_PEDPL|nr:hypothetical protein Cflav_PD4751 [Pedosphaera parvula Ellin514]
MVSGLNPSALTPNYYTLQSRGCLNGVFTQNLDNISFFTVRDPMRW